MVPVEGPFDVILWSSAMHYEQDPARVLANIADRLTPGGMLILECGIVPGTARQYASARQSSSIAQLAMQPATAAPPVKLMHSLPVGQAGKQSSSVQ